MAKIIIVLGLVIILASIIAELVCIPRRTYTVFIDASIHFGGAAITLSMLLSERINDSLIENITCNKWNHLPYAFVNY